MAGFNQNVFLQFKHTRCSLSDLVKPKRIRGQKIKPNKQPRIQPNLFLLCNCICELPHLGHFTSFIFSKFKDDKTYFLSTNNRHYV